MNNKINLFALITASFLPSLLLATNMDQWCSNNTSDGVICMAKLATTVQDSLVVQKCVPSNSHTSGQVEIKYSITQPAVTTTTHYYKPIGTYYSFKQKPPAPFLQVPSKVCTLYAA